MTMTMNRTSDADRVTSAKVIYTKRTRILTATDCSFAGNAGGYLLMGLANNERQP
jgi:predicted HTH transcriptional regulator